MGLVAGWASALLWHTLNDILKSHYIGGPKKVSPELGRRPDANFTIKGFFNNFVLSAHLGWLPGGDLVLEPLDLHPNRAGEAWPE